VAIKIPFKLEHNFEYAKLEKLTPLIRRVTARNPSGFTFHGTGTYIIGRKDVAVIDPGPLLEEHIQSLKRLLSGENITHILITHTHMDHSPAAAPLKDFWGVKTFGFGPHGGGIGNSQNTEAGGDKDFAPDVVCKDGTIISADDWTIECVHTPGHTSNHLCFALLEENSMFTGDHVMGWSTSVIGPPDGNMTDYIKSLEKLLGRKESTYWPTHGSSIDNVREFVKAFIDHRLEREEQILSCLRQGVNVISEMIPIMYSETDPSLHPAAARSAFAAIIRLVETGRVSCDTTEPKIDAEYFLS
jgi:glyoxylase-like metal-dependent hydrolase (beta-lactamase superfamily II)